VVILAESDLIGWLKPVEAVEKKSLMSVRHRAVRRRAIASPRSTQTNLKQWPVFRLV
jgi:hypothetical protein